tara:strand:- start:628 stop:1209 length:582 start_codon:yes stop_codon:yes gene_type:complete
MSSEKIGFIFLLLTCMVFGLLGLFLSSYFHIITIPLLLLFIYSIIESFFPSIHGTLFNKKARKVFNDNGENLVFFDKKKEGIKLKFNKKNKILDGNFTSYYMQTFTSGLLVASIEADFKNGKINGEAREFSISGGVNRLVETYKDGCLVNRKTYLTGYATKGQLLKDESFDKTKAVRGTVQKEIDGHIKEYKL